jgi:hypothetical protein
MVEGIFTDDMGPTHLEVKGKIIHLEGSVWFGLFLCKITFTNNGKN